MRERGGPGAEAAPAAKNLGANDIYGCARTARFIGPAVERLSNAPIKEVVVTDSINLPPERRFDTLRTLTVGDLLAKAIRFTHADQSVSVLFE